MIVWYYSTRKNPLFSLFFPLLLYGFVYNAINLFSIITGYVNMKKNNKNGWWKGVPRNIIFAALIFIGFFIILQQLTDYSRQISTISYTTFLDKVVANQVSKV